MFRLFIIFILLPICIQAQESVFDKKKVQERLELLNKNTPIELIYNSAVEKHIKSYIFKGKSNISKML